MKPEPFKSSDFLTDNMINRKKIIEAIFSNFGFSLPTQKDIKVGAKLFLIWVYEFRYRDGISFDSFHVQPVELTDDVKNHVSFPTETEWVFRMAPTERYITNLSHFCDEIHKISEPEFLAPPIINIFLVKAEDYEKVAEMLQQLKKKIKAADDASILKRFVE